MAKIWPYGITPESLRRDPDLNWDTNKTKGLIVQLENADVLRRDPDLNWDIPKETGSQGQRSTRLCHLGIISIF